MPIPASASCSPAGARSTSSSRASPRIPSARPIRDVANFTSGYGVRSDPFRGRAAMHAGIDLAGPIGTPIYATADGIVGRSEWNSGGYGNLVEINHGQGIQTRYGHLSRCIAQPGQRVRRGELIGLMGSTGRSTGSHLHYEVRIDGRAVNPIPFMQSSQTLVALQRRGRRPGAGGRRWPGGGPAGGRALDLPQCSRPRPRRNGGAFSIDADRHVCQQCRGLARNPRRSRSGRSNG